MGSIFRRFKLAQRNGRWRRCRLQELEDHLFCCPTERWLSLVAASVEPEMTTPEPLSRRLSCTILTRPAISGTQFLPRPLKFARTITLRRFCLRAPFLLLDKIKARATHQPTEAHG